MTLENNNILVVRHDWTGEQISALYKQPLMDLLFTAQRIHRMCFKPNEVQLSTLLSIKTGGCPEDCAYCPQSVHFKTPVENKALFQVDEVIRVAKAAKTRGATRFCMGAAWRKPPSSAIPRLTTMIAAVKALGLETCVTLGTLDEPTAIALRDAGLDYYNHNLDTSPEYYKKIITTRTYEERLGTLKTVREVGLKVCCGGIIGMGETREDRIGLLLQLANLPEHPESVPINRLMRVAGTPAADVEDISGFEFVATIAIARIIMPLAKVRLSAGRTNMSDELQALCFIAGANSIFYGEEKLLTTPNPTADHDLQLMQRLGITASA